MQAYAFELQTEVDFWVSGARREGVLRRHTPVDGGTVHTVADDSMPTSIGSSSESPQEKLHAPPRRRRRRVFPPESEGDAVDRLLRATLSGDEGTKDALGLLVFERHTAKERSTEAAEKASSHSLEKIENSTTAVGGGRGWFWGAAA